MSSQFSISLSLSLAKAAFNYQTTSADFITVPVFRPYPIPKTGLQTPQMMQLSVLKWIRNSAFSEYVSAGFANSNRFVVGDDGPDSFSLPLQHSLSSLRVMKGADLLAESIIHEALGPGASGSVPENFVQTTMTCRQALQILACIWS